MSFVKRIQALSTEFGWETPSAMVDGQNPPLPQKVPTAKSRPLESHASVGRQAVRPYLRQWRHTPLLCADAQQCLLPLPRQLAGRSAAKGLRCVPGQGGRTFQIVIPSKNQAQMAVFRRPLCLVLVRGSHRHEPWRDFGTIARIKVIVGPTECAPGSLPLGERAQSSSLRLLSRSKTRLLGG